MTRKFIIRVHECPTNHTRPYNVYCSSMQGVIDELDAPRRCTIWVKEIVGGEEVIHRGKIIKESGVLAESTYFYEDTQIWHESKELENAIESRRTKKAVLA